MEKKETILKTVLGTVVTALSLSVPAMAQDEEPAVERDTVLLDPLYFIEDNAAVSDEAENQRLWNELMKYKLWGTQSIIFNKHDFKIKETSGYTGTAVGDVVFNDYGHTLGGPILSGQDLFFANGSAANDSLIGGPIYARNLYLPNNYKIDNSRYDGNICFEGDIIFNEPSKNNGEGWQYQEYLNTINRFIENAHRKIENDPTRKEGKVYANWENGLSAINLDGSYGDCPEDVPQPDRKLSVPLIKNINDWDPAINVFSNMGKIVFVHVPPITDADLKQNPKKVWYDKYVEDLIAGGSTGEIIYILMPSSKWNANKKTGRLTRIFSRDGFNLQGSANDLKIQVAIVNDKATWNENTQRWENLNEPELNSANDEYVVSEDKPYWVKNTKEWVNLDKLNINPVADSNYAGNLLFYTTADVSWDAMVDVDYQGTFMTAGNFTIEDHLNIAGQLIAGKTLKFESDVNGEFHYVPFNGAEIKAGIFASDKFKENNDTWYDMNFYLTDTVHTDVTFDYCLAFLGTDYPNDDHKYDSFLSKYSNTFATSDDLVLEDTKHSMPLCSKKEVGHVVIAKGTRSPTKETMPYIKVREEGADAPNRGIEGDEWMVFKITNMNGASIAGGTFDGGILVRLVDANNKKPVFVDPAQVTLAVPENETLAVAGQIQASDEEDDEFEFAIVDGNSDLFEINKKTGVVSMKSGAPAFDYETWRSEGTSYSITVEVCEVSTAMMQCSDYYTYPISIIDVNEKPYFDYLAAEEKVIKIAENEKVSSDKAKYNDEDVYTAAFAKDKDEVIAVGGDTALFDVTKTGYLKTKAGVVLDYEIKDTYVITLRVRDKDTENYPEHYDEMEFTIKVTDVDDGPKFDLKTYNGNVDENSLPATVVNMDDAIYASSTQVGAVITYSLIDSTNSFVIDPSTGVITVAEGAVLNYETKNVYNMKVVASDESGVVGQKVQYDTSDVVIKINNLRHYLKETVFSVAEDAAKATKITPSLEATEVGTTGDGDKYTYYILDDSKKETSKTDVFELDAETGTFSVIAGLDYETEDIYFIDVRVKTEDGGYVDTTVTINVIDVNEAPSVIVDTVYVKENQAINDPFSTVKTDKDDPDTKNEKFRDNKYENTDKNEVFKVNPNGDVVLLKPIDYEADSLYSIMVRVTDKGDSTLTSTKKVIVKVIDVFEQSEVTITRIETRDSIYLRQDSVFVNTPVVNIEWIQDEKTKSSNDSLKKGCNTVIKSYKDPSKNAPGADTVVICYSTAIPVVTISANGNHTDAENIYTVVEKTADSDTAIYVNKLKNDVKVTVKDTAANVSKSFTVQLELDTVSVGSKDFKNLTKVADTKVTRESTSEVKTTAENEYLKNSYTKLVSGVEVTISYYTDSKGKDVKTSVITSSGKTKEIAVIQVSYTTKVNGKEVTVSYYADASTGERVLLNTGLQNNESVLSAEGDNVTGAYVVSYNYVDKEGNNVEVSYYLDEKGKLVKNKEGNIAYKVGYTYANKYGNSSKKDVLIVLDQKGPTVKIETPSEDDVLTANFTIVKWTVNGVEQDTLRVQGLEKGVNTIIRVFRDKAGNESRDSVHVMVKNVKDINIDVEKPVTLVDRDSVEKYYKGNSPKKNENYSVSFYNHKDKTESEAIVGIKGKAQDGSGKEPYPGFEGGHLGPTMVVDARVPVVNALGGLATLDDIMSSGEIALEGVDAANSKKMSVSNYVKEYCTDEFNEEFSKSKDYSRLNLYWTTLKVDVWLYANTSEFVDHYSFDYELDDPDYVSEAGLLKFFFELKPDENGDVRTADGRLFGTGAYLVKTDVRMSSKLRCTLPPVSDEKAEKKKNAVIKSGEELLKTFGYRRPVDK